MNRMLETFGVALCGLATSFAVAVLDVLLSPILGTDFFTSMVWFLIPVGAMSIGFIGASGYYVGAKLLHVRPNRALLLQIIAIAAFTQFLIYWMDYELFIYHRRIGLDAVPFTKYLFALLTKTHYRLGGPLSGIVSDMGQAGWFGVVTACLQLGGTMVGGFMVFIKLRTQMVCPDCGKYLNTCGSKTLYFRDNQSASQYYNEFNSYPLDSAQGVAEFTQFMQRNPTAPILNRAKGKRYAVNSSLMLCPACRKQYVWQRIKIRNERGWDFVRGFDRLLKVPGHVELSWLF